MKFPPQSAGVLRTPAPILGRLPPGITALQCHHSQLEVVGSSVGGPHRYLACGNGSRWCHCKIGNEHFYECCPHHQKCHKKGKTCVCK
jgi:hypothetical protein